MIVGITGLKRSGKSLAASFLTERGFVRVGFSDPIKRMLTELGLGADEITGHLKELPSPLLFGKTPRWAQQTLGTEWGRQLIHPLIWVGTWDRKACDVLDHGGNIVADDIREECEANAVRRLGGVVIRIARARGRVDSHPTEQQQFAADITISNNSSVEALYQAINAHLFGEGI
jgi:hypothetical protein